MATTGTLVHRLRQHRMRARPLGWLREQLGPRLWDDQRRPALLVPALILGRTLVAIARSVVSTERNFQVGLLTYTTLMTIVPVLAVAFAIVAAFGGLARLQEELLARVLEYLTPSTARVVAEHLGETLRSLRQAPIGTLGLLFVALAVFTLLSQIELALNHIWQAPRGRPWGARLPLYWSVATLTPLLLVAGLALAQKLALPIHLGGVVFTALGFAATYKLLPNRAVAGRWALFGGLVAAILFALMARGFVLYTTYIADYSIIYGSLAALPIFLLWLFALWHVALAGAAVAFANQHPYAFGHARVELSRLPLDETMGVAVVCARTAARHDAPPSLDALAHELGTSAERVAAGAQRLVRAKLLLPIGEGPERRYQLCCPPEKVSVAELLDAAAGVEPSEHRSPLGRLSLAELAQAAARG